MTRKKIIADEKIPYLKGTLDPFVDIYYLPGKSISPDIVKSANAIITRTRTKCNAELLEDSNVQFIASATIGFDHIDTEFCDRSGVKWTNSPGCNSSSVEQYIVSALLFLGHERGMDLSEQTLGVIGVGNVGTKICRAARFLGMRVLKNDPPRARVEGDQEFVELSDLLHESDIISIHVPLNMEGEDKTYQFVNQAFIDQMKRGSRLINTSRGAVVDEEVVKTAIRNGILSDVIMDVFTNEPDIDSELHELITLATPHIAGYSADGKANGTMMSVRAVSRFFDLGLDEWKPDDVPVPDLPEIYLDATDRSVQEQLWAVYKQTYDIAIDDKNLRKFPDLFESLREEYPLRREPTAYSVRVFNGGEEIFMKLEGLGFSIIR